MSKASELLVLLEGNPPGYEEQFALVLVDEPEVAIYSGSKKDCEDKIKTDYTKSYKNIRGDILHPPKVKIVPLQFTR